MRTKQIFSVALLITSLIAANACRLASGREAINSTSPCHLALAQHSGEAEIDKRMARLQHDIRANARPSQNNALIEKLGWSFVEKARASDDPGFYRLAEQCALCLESRQSASKQNDQPAANQPLSSDQSLRASALLLRGHALHNLHRFAEAEKLARELVQTRGIAYDFGLLGDAARRKR
jgi:hypothetical protein